MGGSPDSGQGFGGFHVKFPGVGLACYGKNLIEADLLRDKTIEFTHLCMVTVKQFDEGSLGSDGSLGTTRFNLAFQLFNVGQVKQEVLYVQGVALANRCGLGRLVMGVSKGGNGFMGGAESSEVSDDPEQRFLDQAQSFLLDQEVGITDDKLGGGAEMDDGFGKGALLAVGIDMRHDIVAYFPFLGSGYLVVDRIDMALQFGNHFGSHGRQSQFMLCLSQGNPALAPVGEFELLGKKLLHFAASVPRDQRFLINGAVHGYSL